MNRVYVTNPKVNILYKNRFVLSSADIVEAMNYANRALKELSDTTMKFDIFFFPFVLFEVMSKSFYTC